MNEYAGDLAMIDNLINGKPASREASIARTNLQTAELFVKVHGHSAHQDIRHYLKVAELWAHAAPPYAEGTVPDVGR